MDPGYTIDADIEAVSLFPGDRHFLIRSNRKRENIEPLSHSRHFTIASPSNRPLMIEKSIGHACDSLIIYGILGIRGPYYSRGNPLNWAFPPPSK